MSNVDNKNKPFIRKIVRNNFTKEGEKQDVYLIMDSVRRDRRMDCKHSDA